MSDLMGGLIGLQTATRTLFYLVAGFWGTRLAAAAGKKTLNKDGNRHE